VPSPPAKGPATRQGMSPPCALLIGPRSVGSNPDCNVRPRGRQDTAFGCKWRQLLLFCALPFDDAHQAVRRYPHALNGKWRESQYPEGVL